VARGVAPLENLQALYQLVHELDPSHPLVLGDTRDKIKYLQKDRRDFFPTAAWMPASGGGIRFRSALPTAMGSKATNRTATSCNRRRG